MPVVTISREVGSGGAAIGQQVAAQLGYQLVDKTLLAHVLEEYGVGHLEFTEIYENKQSFWDRYTRRTEEVFDLLNRLFLALAKHGSVVILGRGSYAVLGGYADVLNVRLHAPFDFRVQQILLREICADLDEASEFVRENDRKRVSFVESAYMVRWNAAHAFDMVLNTSKIQPDWAVSWIVDTVRTLPLEPVVNQRTTHQIDADPVLLNFLAERHLATG